MKRTKRVFRFTIDGVESSVEKDMEHDRDILNREGSNEAMLELARAKFPDGKIDGIELRDYTYED